jgi:hypothetical protein
VIAICIIVALVALIVPVGPSEASQGVVLSLGWGQSGRGPQQFAVVGLPNGSPMVSLSQPNTCHVDGRIHLLRQHHFWGRRYVAALVPCD